MIKKNGDELYTNWKGYNSLFNSWIDKKDIIEMSQYFSKPHEYFGWKVKVELDLSNYATKK